MAALVSHRLLDLASRAPRLHNGALIRRALIPIARSAVLNVLNAENDALAGTGGVVAMLRRHSFHGFM
jgi:hypothetical protein